MQELSIIHDPAVAGITLDPVRARRLAELVEPGSASSIGAKLGLPRQKINYHLRTLEQHGLVHLVEERRKGNMTERVMQASAASYVISPAALDPVAPDPRRTRTVYPRSGSSRLPHAQCGRSASSSPVQPRWASG